MLSGRISKAGSTRELLRLAAAHCASLNHIHAANLWNKLGKQGDASESCHREDMRRLLRRTVELVESCGAQGLSNIAHGLAKCRLVGLGGETGALFAAVAEAAVPRLREFNAQGLANTVWAFATAGHAAPELLEAIAKAAVPQLGEFTPQALANTVWAFATAGHAAPELLDAIAKAAVPRLGEFSAQELATTAWAFAKAGQRAPELLEAIAAAAVPRLREFNAQDLANTAWAFAAADHLAPELLEAIAKAAEPRLHEFNAQALANTVWVFATAGHAAPVLLEAIAKAAVPRLGNFTAQALANTAWAFATAGHAAPALLEAIAKAAVARLGEFNAQAIANTAWAFTAADQLAPALFDSHAFVQLCAECSLAPKELRQLHQWQLWREERGAAWPPLPPALAQRCRDAFCQEEGAPSRLQRDVVASLRALGLAPREEERTPQGYSLDVVVSHGGREVAVEVDGPSHFVGRMPTGATALKRRQLRAAGWALL